MSIGVALYGRNGHQIHDHLLRHPSANLVSICSFPRAGLPEGLRDESGVTEHHSFEDLLSDPHVDFISLCSPRRSEQSQQAIRALRAGKHVYAEKPCAMTEAGLDALMRTARETGKHFHEMAGTAFQQPYYAMRRIVREGRLGEVVQVIAEKSYPYFERRPQDEDIDGGLIAQNAIHAVRFVEHVACTRIRSVQAIETSFGNPEPGGGLRMAACLMCELEGGGVASLSANYLNPPGSGIWGYESLRILGTLGMVESLQGGKFTRLVLGDRDFGSLDTSEPGINYLDAFLQTILDGSDMPLSLDEELSPTRWVIRAKQMTLQPSVT
jgi:predicted dehydrogenase